ncbi:hypothetical protein Bca4012_010027 [Brassica carinata]
MSSSKGSSKRHSSSHSSSDDASANEVIAPKEEFGVDEDAKDVYYKAICGSLSSLQDIPIPKRPVRSPNAPLTPRMVSPRYLATLRNFYQVPSEVMFRIPSGNESARNPPEGFFTCYEAFLSYCRMWFPIPDTIVRALHRFFGIDGVIVLALDIFPFVVDVLIFTRALLFCGRFLRVVFLGEDFHLFLHYDEVRCLVQSVLDRSRFFERYALSEFRSVPESFPQSIDCYFFPDSSDPCHY